MVTPTDLDTNTSVSKPARYFLSLIITIVTRACAHGRSLRFSDRPSLVKCKTERFMHLGADNSL